LKAYLKGILTGGSRLSEKSLFGLSAAEKFFGLILLIVGAVSAYFTFTSSDALGPYTGFFGVLSLILAALGFIMIIAKIE